MKKAAFILPYFGKFPNYFQLFLNSCEKNSDYDWFIFTDDRTDYIYPANVHVEYMSFWKFATFVKQRFTTKVVLNHPKKLCDFKPLYGFIFSEYLKDYPYWGYCDCDLIFGKIDNFIDFEELKDYAKIGICGHLTLLKNTQKINEFFKNDVNFKDIFSTDANLVYDEGFEGSVNNILENMGEKIFNFSGIADIDVNDSNFVLVNYDFKSRRYLPENKVNSFFIWNNGQLLRYIIGKDVRVEEKIYIHLQKRLMKVSNTNLSLYKIIPNSFDDVENAFFENKFKDIKIKHINFHKINFLVGKIRNKIIRNWK